MNIQTCNLRNQWNTGQHFGATPRCQLHWYLMRGGTPLTRSWFMPALNTQRCATVLTHPSKCFNHAEYHYCVTVYRSDVKSELQSVCKEILIFLGFTLFPFSYIHRHALVMQNTTFVWLSMDLMCNLSYKVFTNLTLTGFTLLPNWFVIITFNYADLNSKYGCSWWCICTLNLKQNLSHGLSPPPQ